MSVFGIVAMQAALTNDNCKMQKKFFRWESRWQSFTTITWKLHTGLIYREESVGGGEIEA